MKADKRERIAEVNAKIAALFEGDPKPAPTCSELERPCGCLVHHPECNRCARVASAAEKRGDPVPTPELVETAIVDGKRVFYGLCRECADVEWSINWDRSFELAKGDDLKRARLLERVIEREQTGRAYLGSKHPNGPTTKHSPECRCSRCRPQVAAGADR